MSKLKYTDQRLTEGNETVGYRLKDYGSTNLVSMYRNYDVFFAHLQSTQRLGFLEDMLTLRPVEDWGEDDGSCLWWDSDTIEQEPMYVGSPLDSCWDDTMKYFIQIPNPLKKEVADDTD